jgi:hypothetical protein
MVTAEQWEALADFRKSIEAEYQKNVQGKPERLPAYDETIGVLKEATSRYGIDTEDPEQVYVLSAGIVSTISFISQYFNVVCHDMHMMGHLSEAAIFMGYLVRELCFVDGAPMALVEEG